MREELWKDRRKGQKIESGEESSNVQAACAVTEVKVELCVA